MILMRFTLVWMRCSPVVSALTVNVNNATILGSISTSVHILVLKTVHKKNRRNKFLIKYLTFLRPRNPYSLI
jgi:hypothetical protein